MSYSTEQAAKYWGQERLSTAKNELETVGYLNKPLFINQYYTKWESHVLETILSKLSPNCMLDLACGVGRFTNILAENRTATKVIAVDLTQQMLDICKSKINTQYLHKMSFIQTSCTSIPLDNDSVDTIICLGLFEHLPPDLHDETLREIARILPRKGSLILEINNNKSTFLRDLNDNPHRKAQQLQNGYFCGLIDKGEIERLLLEMNLEIVATYKNPLFSILYHLFLELEDHSASTQEDWIEKWMDVAYKYDTSTQDSSEDIFSDQFIFEIVKN